MKVEIDIPEKMYKWLEEVSKKFAMPISTFLTYLISPYMEMYYKGKEEGNIEYQGEKISAFDINYENIAVEVLEKLKPFYSKGYFEKLLKPAVNSFIRFLQIKRIKITNENVEEVMKDYMDYLEKRLTSEELKRRYVKVAYRVVSFILNKKL